MNNDSPRRAILAPFFLIVEKGFFPQSSLDHDAEIMQHRNHHRAGAPIDCSCLIKAGTLIDCSCCGGPH